MLRAEFSKIGRSAWLRFAKRSVDFSFVKFLLYAGKLHSLKGMTLVEFGLDPYRDNPANCDFFD